MRATPDSAEPAAAALEELVRVLHRQFLNREPAPKELAHWMKLGEGVSPAELLRRFTASPAYLRHQGVPCFWPAGHYHSPVVDPRSLGDHLEKARAQAPGDLLGIRLDIEAMLRLLDAHAAELAALPIPETNLPDRRFSVEGGPFPAGDAASLYLVMANARPRRIVEIGSGYSTAAMLDFADQLGLEGLALTCVEPYPDRLHSLLWPEDAGRLTLIQRAVQELTAEDLVAPLEAGDILFIDSTHVLKTGSDVHYELFQLLPRVKPGVIVHFHDCPWPFEYPEFWVKERNYSWNEAYALRAFLTFNERFEVLFWASLLKARAQRALTAAAPHFTGNPGSSIWLRRVAV